VNNYNAEALRRWGDTAEYRDHAEKTKNYTQEKWTEVNAGLMDVFTAFAECVKNGEKTDSPAAQALAQRLKDYISENYYTCPNAVFAGLGEMYTADGRFKNNIDRCGKGTAEFAAAAIKYYCRKAECE